MDWQTLLQMLMNQGGGSPMTGLGGGLGGQMQQGGFNDGLGQNPSLQDMQQYYRMMQQRRMMQQLQQMQFPGLQPMSNPSPGGVAG